MGTSGVTAAAVINFAAHLEDRSALFYKKLVDQFPDKADFLRSFVRESELNKVLVVRTYQETVTDALETGYSFEGLSLDGVIPEEVWSDKADFAAAISSALGLERAASAFYIDVSSRSKTLLSTIYMAFRKVEGVRRKRLVKLESLHA